MISLLSGVGCSLALSVDIELLQEPQEALHGPIEKKPRGHVVHDEEEERRHSVEQHLVLVRCLAPVLLGHPLLEERDPKHKKWEEVQLVAKERDLKRKTKEAFRP